MSLLSVEKTLREALEALDEYGLAIAGIHVANALQALEVALAQSDSEDLDAVAGGGAHHN